MGDMPRVRFYAASRVSSRRAYDGKRTAHDPPRSVEAIYHRDNKVRRMTPVARDGASTEGAWQIDNFDPPRLWCVRSALSVAERLQATSRQRLVGVLGQRLPITLPGLLESLQAFLVQPHLGIDIAQRTGIAPQ
jgi:hypothetical protein